MSLLFTAEINSLPIDGFAINGFSITAFRTYGIVPYDGAQFSAVAVLKGDPDDECCDGVMIPPAKSPVRTPWGSTRWLR